MATWRFSKVITNCEARFLQISSHRPPCRWAITKQINTFCPAGTPGLPIRCDNATGSRQNFCEPYSRRGRGAFTAKSLAPGKLKRFLRVQCVQGCPKGPGNLRMRRDQHRLAGLLFYEFRQEGIVLYHSPSEDYRVGESVHFEYSFDNRVE